MSLLQQGLEVVPGYFIVSPHPIDDDKFKDIRFQRSNSADAIGQVPRDQSALKGRVERFLTLLRMTKAVKESDKRHYYSCLLSLSQYGLAGEAAEPIQADETLQNLEEEFLHSEKKNIRGEFVARYFFSAIFFILLIFVIGFISAQIFENVDIMRETVSFNQIVFSFSSFIMAFLGISASSFWRSGADTFEQLRKLEVEDLSPVWRHVFGAVVLLFMMILLKSEVVSISIGKVTSAEFDSNFYASATLGIFVGIGLDRIAKKIDGAANQSAA